MRVIVALFYVLAALGAVAGAFELLLTFDPKLSAPQQAAGAATACGLAVIPYVLARALEGAVKPWPPSLEQIERHERLAAAALQAPGNQPASAATTTGDAKSAATSAFARRHT